MQQHVVDVALLPNSSATYINNNGRTSWIDHIPVSSMFNISRSACVISHPPGNRSTHRALHLSMPFNPVIDAQLHCASRPNPSRTLCCQVLRKKATTEQLNQYQKLLQQGMKAKSWDFATDGDLTSAIDDCATDLISIIKETAACSYSAAQRPSPWISWQGMVV